MFARCLLCVFCLVFLIGCGADKNIVEEDEEGSDGVSLDSYSGDVPTVSLVTELLWDDELSIQFSLEADRPLKHNLSIYFEQVLSSTSGHSSSSKGFLGILQGETESLSFISSSSFYDKIVLTILPASMRKEVVLPSSAYVGQDGGTKEEMSFPVPVGHQFKPYKIGDSKEIVVRREDLDGAK